MGIIYFKNNKDETKYSNKHKSHSRGKGRIYNDSPYELKAFIMTADGKTQGSMTIPPQQQSQWQDFSGANAIVDDTAVSLVTLICKFFLGSIFNLFKFSVDKF